MKFLKFIKNLFAKKTNEELVVELKDNSKQSEEKSVSKKNKKRRKPKSSNDVAKPNVKKEFEHKAIAAMPEIVEVEAVEGKISFTELPIRKEILAALQDLNFKYCTPIQGMSLPASLAGKDIAGKAQTGTGKTASFLIAALNHLLDNPISTHRHPGSVRVMILAPTRELAIQIHKDCEALCKYIDFNNVVIFGGMGHHAQRERLSKPVDILVATPGRCIDFMNQNVVDLSKTEILIIDEADRMLDMGFIPDVRRIVGKTPHPGKRHTMMFSATLTESVLRLIRSWQRDPVTIETESEELVTDLIEQKFYSVLSKDKMSLLHWILQKEEVTRMIIFINRKDQASRVVNNLAKLGYEAVEMSGDVPQQKRLRMIEDLRAGKIKILVATDVAARGLHVNDISHVINYDLPVKSEDYVHRIGRTGRAGKCGFAYSFVCESGAYVLDDLEKLLDRKISCEWLDSEQLASN